MRRALILRVLESIDFESVVLIDMPQQLANRILSIYRVRWGREFSLLYLKEDRGLRR
jgi:hypothetical protein